MPNMSLKKNPMPSLDANVRNKKILDGSFIVICSSI